MRFLAVIVVALGLMTSPAKAVMTGEKLGEYCGDDERFTKGLCYGFITGVIYSKPGVECVLKLDGFDFEGLRVLMELYAKRLKRRGSEEDLFILNNSAILLVGHVLKSEYSTPCATQCIDCVTE